MDMLYGYIEAGSLDIGMKLQVLEFECLDTKVHSKWMLKVEKKTASRLFVAKLMG